MAKPPRWATMAMPPWACIATGRAINCSTIQRPSTRKVDGADNYKPPVENANVGAGPAPTGRAGGARGSGEGHLWWAFAEPEVVSLGAEENGHGARMR